jgi:hypothetical protein
MQIRPVGAELFRADGWKDMPKLAVVDISSQAKVGNDAGSKREIRAVTY